MDINSLVLWYAFGDAGVPLSVYEWAKARYGKDRIRLGLMIYEQWFYEPDLLVECRSLVNAHYGRVMQQYGAIPEYLRNQIQNVCIDIELHGFWWRACTISDSSKDHRCHMGNLIGALRGHVGRRGVGWYGIPTRLNSGTTYAGANRITDQYIAMALMQDVFYPSCYYDARLASDANVKNAKSLVMPDNRPRPLRLATRTVPIVSRWRTHAEGDRHTTPLTIDEFVTCQVAPLKSQGVSAISLWDSNDWPAPETGGSEARCKETIAAIADRLGWKEIA